MSKQEKEVIEELLKQYPDVIEFLGGKEAVSSDVILERLGIYINKHKWFVNEKIPYTITLEQAFFSWYENVFTPQSFEMQRTNITKALSHLSKYDIFKIVSDEYYYLSEKNKSTYYNKACYSIIARESKSFFARKYAQFSMNKY